MSEALRLEIFSASDSPSAASFPTSTELEQLTGEALAARASLLAGNCPGADFLGWLDLPISAEAWIPEILDLSLQLVEDVDHLLVAGIGGSYLGARALLEAFSVPGPCGGRIVLDQAGWEPVGPEIHFTGEHLGGAEIAELMRRLRGRNFAVNVISKSGTTMETALAFRLLRQELEERHGDQADRYIIATTDPERGALRSLAEERGWNTFPIPADVGGRFSVLSPVGLLPLAAAGLHVEALLEGARVARERFRGDAQVATDARGGVDLLLNNPALHYAALRKHFHATGKKVEVLACFEPSLTRLGDWWVQLFGESEGKDGKGLFPARAAYSTDLHSLGQYMQEGPRQLVETFVSVDEVPRGPGGPPPGPSSPAGTTTWTA